MAIFSCPGTSRPIRFAFIISCPLEDGKITTTSYGTRITFPFASIRSRPLKDEEVPTTSCTGTRKAILVITIRSRPLKGSKVPTTSCSVTGPPIPFTSIRSRPLDDDEMPTTSYSRTCITIPVAGHFTVPMATHFVVHTRQLFHNLNLCVNGFLYLLPPKPVSTHADGPIIMLPSSIVLMRIPEEFLLLNVFSRLF